MNRRKFNLYRVVISANPRHLIDITGWMTTEDSAKKATERWAACSWGELTQHNYTAQKIRCVRIK